MAEGSDNNEAFIDVDHRMLGIGSSRVRRTRLNTAYRRVYKTGFRDGYNRGYRDGYEDAAYELYDY